MQRARWCFFVIRSFTRAITPRARAPAGLTIGVDMMQTLSMFGSFHFAWPVTITNLFNIASATTFSPELTAPECTIEFTYKQKWFLLEIFPLGFAALLVVGVLVTCFYANARKWNTAQWVPPPLPP